MLEHQPDMLNVLQHVRENDVDQVLENSGWTGEAEGHDQILKVAQEPWMPSATHPSG